MISRFIALVKALKLKLDLGIIHKRLSVTHHTGKPVACPAPFANVLFIIAHVVSPDKQDNNWYLQRLITCLDSLLRTFDLLGKRIILLSKEGCSLYEQLPEYLKNEVEPWYSKVSDPMLVEYDAWDIMLENDDLFDYYVFLEDDIIMEDTTWFEKIRSFNEAIADPTMLLYPHRYEYKNGIKYYNDLMLLAGDEMGKYHFAGWLGLSLGNVRFCQFENPHAGMYCLSRQQWHRWKQRGNPFKYKVTAYGTLESAATFNMMHHFEIFKPHPDQLNFLQVRHLGSKYLDQKINPQKP